MIEGVVGVDVPGPPESERRFTAPTDLCPHPERWTSTDGDSTEEEVCDLVYGLVRGLQPGLVLETGTGFGATAWRIGAALEENGQGRLVTLEADADRVAYCRDRLGPYECVEVVHADTLGRWSGRNWEPPASSVFDLCWFDSWYPLRVPEFRRFRPFMRRGTIVGFHDTAPGHGALNLAHESIRRTVERELAGEIRLIHLPTPRGVTLGEVR